MKLTLSKSDGSRTIVKCDYIRPSKDRLYMYIHDWVHYIATLTIDTQGLYCLKIWTPKECVDSYKVVYGYSVVIEDETKRGS